MKRSRFPLVVVALSGIVAPASLSLARAQPPDIAFAANPAPDLAGEGEAWGAYTAFDKKLGDVARDDPQAAIAALQEFLEANPGLHPIVAALTTARIAEMYRDGLKSPDKALEIYAEGLNKYQGQPAVAMIIEGQTRTLFEHGKAGAALDFVQAQWPQMVLAEQTGHPYLRGVVSRALQWRVRALQKAGKTPEAVALLKSSLSQMPSLLDPQHQTAFDWSTGWIYGQLVETLVAGKQYDEALSWAKLGYAEAPFDKDSIERASAWPAQVWAAQGDFAAARGFGQAQSDVTRANPLAKVALPRLDTVALEARLKPLQELQARDYESARAGDIVGLQIALGQLKPAMEEAQALLIKNPMAPDGVQQIARVFKAADGSLVRANQFVAYLDSNGANPIPTFMQDDGAATTAPVAALPAKETEVPSQT